MVGELSSKIEIIENEMDTRVESLISSIHDYRDKCKKKLDLIRDNLKKYFWWLNTNSESIDWKFRTIIVRDRISRTFEQESGYLFTNH